MSSAQPDSRPDHARAPLPRACRAAQGLPRGTERKLRLRKAYALRAAQCVRVCAAAGPEGCWGMALARQAAVLGAEGLRSVTL